MTAEVATQAAKTSNLFARSAKIGGPVAAVGGAIADVASPLASFAMYLTMAGVVLCLITGYMWFGKVQRKLNDDLRTRKITSAELAALKSQNSWGAAFAFSVIGTFIMGGFWMAGMFLGGQQGNGDNTINVGVLGNIEAINALQEQLFKISEKLDAVAKNTEEIKKDTAEIKESTANIEKQNEQIGADLKDIKAGFEALQALGGVKADPKTPQDFYHNATVQAQTGNESAARKSLEQFLAFDADYLDPHLEYFRILKSQEGLAGAQRIYAKTEPKTLVGKLAKIIASPEAAQLAALDALIEESPEFAPAYFYRANLFSQETLGQGTNGMRTYFEMRRERDDLKAFQRLDDEGHLLRYFLNKKEAEDWRKSASERISGMSAFGKMLDEPMKVTANFSGAEATLVFQVMESHNDIQYRIKGQGEFQSTGQMIMPTTGQPILNPQTGKPMCNNQAKLGTLDGVITVEARYTDAKGRLSATIEQVIDPVPIIVATTKTQLGYVKANLVQVQIHRARRQMVFALLASDNYRPGIKEVRYSFNSEAVDQSLDLDKDGGWMQVPDDTEYVAIRIVFIDGSEWETLKFQAKEY